jgi:hypothetical protein
VRNAWLSAALIVVSLAALFLQFKLVGKTGFFVGDFDAFYCASQVAARHQDPYLAEPLRTCESHAGSRDFFKFFPGLTTPAPLPGYAFAALRPLTLLPFGVAAIVWILILILSCAVAIVSVARFANVPWQISLGAFSLSLGVLSIPFGEIVPLSIGLICLSAYFARSGKWLYASLAVLGSFLEPHLALPAALGLIVYAPRTRIPIVAGIVALGLTSIATLGLSVNLEYVTSVLPAHILSEIHRDTQYSLTELLVSLGTPLHVAIQAGTICYAAMVLLGTVVGFRMAGKTGNAAFAVCVPPAFAVCGGTFIHATQIAVAIPAAIVAATYSSGRIRSGAVTALLALSVPWGWVVSIAILMSPVFPVAYIARWYWKNLRNVLLAATATAAITLLLISTPHGHAQRIQASVGIDRKLAEYSWSGFTQTYTRHDSVSWMLRIPTWGGLLLLLVILSREAFLARPRDLVVVESVPSAIT